MLPNIFLTNSEQLHQQLCNSRLLQLLLLLYIEKVINIQYVCQARTAQSTTEAPALFLFDVYATHCGEKINKMNIHLVYVPAGYMALLQVCYTTPSTEGGNLKGGT